jgi:hypothetical protein
MQGEGPSAKDNRRRSFERPNDEILAQLKHSHRAMWFVLLGLLICLIASVVAVFAGRVGSVPLVVGEYFGAATLVVWFLAVFLWIGRRIAPPPEANEERILRTRIDSIQSVWRVMTVFFVFFAFTTTFSVSGGLVRINPHHPALALFAGAVLVFVILLYMLAVFYGPGYLNSGLRIVNDELALALQARAFKAGYLVLMVMLGGALLADLYRPALIIPTLCWMLFAGFAMPTLYYVILQWRTGSGG